MYNLSPDQRYRVEQLVRQKGKTCNYCGSDDLSCGDVANESLGSNINVHLYCNNRDAHPQGVAGIEQPLFPLSRDEARAAGIDVR
jgi:hypothetical protein